MFRVVFHTLWAVTYQLCKMLSAVEGCYFRKAIFGANTVAQNTNDIYIAFDI